MTHNAQGLVDVGRLILRFAKVNRVTFHEDGTRLESDTDHTVMLSVCACALAQKLYPNLDMGLIAQFAIVHDLVEVYADDTDSFNLDEVSKKEKEIREHEAFLRIQNEFMDVYPWISETIEMYEKLDTPEARFVKTVDKTMTQITHILNGGVYFRDRGIESDEMWDDYRTIASDVEMKYGKEFVEITELMKELTMQAREKTYEN